MSMAMAASGGDREQKIREVAYMIWMEEGCPTGRDVDHWLKACERIALAEAVPGDAPAKPAAKPAKPKAAAAARPRKASPRR
ncbi:MAG: DUF2934 domain-containing protein [Rhizobiales bacterium]|nr:DUF2934 domain-containing protein [Hyphomicrobiales bacterium]